MLVVKYYLKIIQTFTKGKQMVNKSVINKMSHFCTVFPQFCRITPRRRVGLAARKAVRGANCGACVEWLNEPASAAGKPARAKPCDCGVGAARAYRGEDVFELFLIVSRGAGRCLTTTRSHRKRLHTTRRARRRRAETRRGSSRRVVGHRALC